MSLESNFRIKELHRHRSAGRLHDIFSILVGAIDAVVAVVAGLGAGGVAGIAIGAEIFTVGQIVVYGVAIGLVAYSVASALSGGGGGGSPSRRTLGGGSSQTQNGQLVSTKKANVPLKVVYGIFRVGGNWVFSRSSPANVNILNIVVTWAEGEITGLAPAIDYTPLFTGSGVNDLHTSGEFSYVGCSCDMTCYSYSPCSCNFSTY